MHTNCNEVSVVVIDNFCYVQGSISTGSVEVNSHNKVNPHIYRIKYHCVVFITCFCADVC